jgi:hypothetical protein
MANAYPLQWPEGWPRTQYRRSSAYKISIDKAVDELMQSLTKLGAQKGSMVLSSNVPPRNALGTPRNDGQTVNDPGVAVYWTTKAHGERVMACDRWSSVRENVRAIGLAVDGLRSIERAGATQILDRAYSAFGALPAAANVPVERPWWEVLALPKEALQFATLAMVEAQYRELATKAHPDRGGSDAAMAGLNRAREQARAHFKGTGA